MESADAETGQLSRITTSPFSGQQAIRAKSCRDIVSLYRRKREAKSLGPHRELCTRATVGLLKRRSVRDLTIRHIGKEANQIEQVTADLVAADQVTATYTHPQRDVHSRLILPALHAFPEAAVAQAAGIPRRTINGLRGGRQPGRATPRRLVPALAQLCVEINPEIDGADYLGLLAASRDRQSTSRVCRACGDTPPDGRVYCRSACRQAAYRRRLTG